MSTRNAAKQALLAQVSDHFDRVEALLADAADGTRFSFTQIGETVGTPVEASRVQYEDSGKKDEDGQPIMVARRNEKGTKITAKTTVIEPPDYTMLLANAVAAAGGNTLVEAGRNAGLHRGAVAETAKVSVKSLKDEAASLRAELAALRASLGK